MASDPGEVKARLDELKREYADQLPGRLRELEDAWLRLEKGPWNAPAFQAFHRGVHALAGSGASFGFPALSERARALDILMKSWGESAGAPDAPSAGLVRAGLSELRKALSSRL